MLHEKLNCEGFFGFGGGYALGTGTNASYCNSCPLSTSCWEKHKKRVAEMMPGVVEEFERMAKTMTGPELVKAWMTKFQIADPYTTVMVGNMEDGTSIAAGGEPGERGEWTLPWPFEPVA